MKEKPVLPLVQDEEWLAPYADQIKGRHERFLDAQQQINHQFGSLVEFARSHQYFGIHHEPWRKGWVYREWAPGAKQLFLMGDFNWWDRHSHPMKKNNRGEWEIFLSESDYAHTFIHGSKVKVRVIGATGDSLDRIPAYMTRVIQDKESHDFAGQLWFPEPFEWSDQSFSPKAIFKEPCIYECHIGMAQEKLGVGTYKEFEENILPRIAAAGYNTIQMMAVMEHPYYGSFGYHVSNFFAPTSRFGTPEELKSLVDKAHEMEIAVVMDIVHSHAVKNVNEGLNEFDGTSNQYFHSGEKGYHEGWDSKLFNYGKQEVQQYLLSNITYWLEEFHFDGFRFDGVTSMIYTHHGHQSFDDAGAYFDEGVAEDALLYLQLANTLIHKIKPDGISIAEEVSGMPGLCRKISDGGIGFDFRLAMGIPDYWIKTLKHSQDEHWDMFELWHQLTNRPVKEKSIAYAESHDQALVGDKSIAFWLMDKEMYTSMSVLQQNLVVDRGMALHKLIRMITLSLGGEGYLNFIGNEFGHPEWVDFPRKGNEWSYLFARRQWSLVDDPLLRYGQLFAWDQAMISLTKTHQLLESPHAVQLHLDADKKILAYQRGKLVFVFSFHPSESLLGFEIKMPHPGSYQIILDSDEKRFGGFARLDQTISYSTDKNISVSLYLPNRCMLVLEREQTN